MQVNERVFLEISIVCRLFSIFLLFVVLLMCWFILPLFLRTNHSSSDSRSRQRISKWRRKKRKKERADDYVNGLKLKRSCGVNKFKFVFDLWESGTNWHFGQHKCFSITIQIIHQFMIFKKIYSSIFQIT